MTFLSLLFSSVKPSNAQDISYACIGNALAQYMNQVIESAGPLTYIKLLSPAFNMTNPYGAAIAAEMVRAGANFNALTGIAGNAYNCCVYEAAPDGLVTQHVNAFMANYQGAGGPSKPVLITETGVYDGSIDDLRQQMEHVQTESDYIGALFFNALGTGGDEWNRYIINDFSQVCGGSCNKLGVNFATHYPVAETFYEQAAGIKASASTFFTLAISHADDATRQGVEWALNRGLTPVIRIGTSFEAGPDAIGYGQFLAGLDDQIANMPYRGTVYAIAGPNEPQTECWAAPECGCDLSPNQMQNVKRPLYQGFYLGKYGCGTDSVANPEFHPLRPYPASPCDLLIPQSNPEAPENTLENWGIWPLGTYHDKADFEKYNTFACGSSMDFTYNEIFSPYGFPEPGYGDAFDSEVETPTSLGYEHSFCDWSDVTDEERYSTGYFDLTCWRTIGFEVYTDFANSNVGILGNTQNTNLTDEQKVNNYLSWYFSGTPQIGDRIPLNPDEPEDMDRLVNYSGPIRKLLPYDAQEAIREVLRIAAADEEINDIHNYAMDEKGVVRLANMSDVVEQFFPNIPNSTVEDVAGEAFFASQRGFEDDPIEIPPPPGGWEEGEIPPTTAAYQFLVTCALGAHEECPPTRIGIVPPPVDGGGGGGGGGGGETPPPCPTDIAHCTATGTICFDPLDFSCPDGLYCCTNRPNP